MSLDHYVFHILSFVLSYNKFYDFAILFNDKFITLAIKTQSDIEIMIDQTYYIIDYSSNYFITLGLIVFKIVQR